MGASLKAVGCLLEGGGRFLGSRSVSPLGELDVFSNIRLGDWCGLVDVFLVVNCLALVVGGCSTPTT